MPFFELPNDASQGALYYEIYNPHEQSKTGLDPAKETILMLPSASLSFKITALFPFKLTETTSTW